MADTKADNQQDIDQKYIAAVQSGDKDAYSCIVKNYMKKAYYIALGFVKSEPDALDISQDAFIKAYKHIKKFRTGNPFFPGSIEF